MPPSNASYRQPMPAGLIPPPNSPVKGGGNSTTHTWRDSQQRPAQHISGFLNCQRERGWGSFVCHLPMRWIPLLAWITGFKGETRQSGCRLYKVAFSSLLALFFHHISSSPILTPLQSPELTHVSVVYGHTHISLALFLILLLPLPRVLSLPLLRSSFD